MAVDKLVPTANATDAGGLLATNDYTNLDNTVASADSVNGAVTIQNDSTGSGTATWASTTNMSNSISSVNTVTFRVRARVTSATSPDDSITYTVRCTLNSVNYDLTWVCPTDNNAGYATRSNATLPTNLTKAQYDAVTFSLLSSGFSKTKGGDNMQFEIDELELEIDYTEAAGNFTSFGGVSWTSITSINSTTRGNIDSINGSSQY